MDAKSDTRGVVRRGSAPPPLGRCQKILHFFEGYSSGATVRSAFPPVGEGLGVRAVNSKGYFSSSLPGPGRTERSAGPGIVGEPGGKPEVGRSGRLAVAVEAGRVVRKFYSRGFLLWYWFL